MIGVYDYTVILTYLSLLSAGTGIVVSLSGSGHPYIGCVCLLFCGLCDAFDGKVARSKKDRTQMEMNFGIQVDSLSDLVAFGVLPACIGAALIRTSSFLQWAFSDALGGWAAGGTRFVVHAVLVIYVLAAMIRLAWFNVTEEERQKTEGGVRKTYTGLPVTSAALIFPTVLLIHYVLPVDITLVYVAVAILTGYLFLSKIQIPKPGTRGILIMVGVGVLECVLLILDRILFARG